MPMRWNGRHMEEYHPEGSAGRRGLDPGSSTGVKARLSSGQSSPAALATNDTSMAALVPSVKELNIFGLKSPAVTSSLEKP